MDQCPGQGAPVVSATDVETPFGRFCVPPGTGPGGRVVAVEGFLEAAGAIVGSYTLEDRTVFVFQHLTLEIFRGGGLYAIAFDKSTP